MKTWTALLLCLVPGMIGQTADARQPSITIWWTQWDPAVGLQELGEDFEKENFPILCA